MRKRSFKNWHPTDLLPITMLFLLMVLTYGIFFQQPYTGFYFNPSDGTVLQVYTETSGALQVGDTLTQIGPIPWERYLNNRSQTLFVGVRPGQVVPLVILRNGKEMKIVWTFPGFNHAEFLQRLFNLWWLSYIFLLFGAIIQHVMRPKDMRWGLMVAANYLTALWLMVGGLSGSHIWESSVLLHAITWVMLPVYLALHWIFPTPLGRLPRWSGMLLALVSALLVLGEVFKVLPRSAYSLGFFMMLFLSVVLLLFHFFRQPEQRREVSLLLITLLVALAPALSLSIVGAFGNVPQIGPLALVALPIMPAAYFYSVYRRQLGGLEVRTNLLLSIYAFVAIVVTLLILLISPIIPNPITTEAAIFFTVTTATLMALCTVLLFPPFQSFVERRVLGIKLPHENLQETYAARIVTSTTRASLAHLLQDEVIPSLLVRQFVFLRLQDNTPQTLLRVGITEDAIPGGDVLKELVARSGKYRPPASDLAANWVRLALPLKVGSELLGLWLLGRRDPDDAYAQVEIPILQALADQTAIALSNIMHAERLRTMYQTDINRYEQERLRLAHELHDNVLNEMALLLMGRDDVPLPPAFLTGYQRLTQSVRSIASDLRPPMLEYGLKLALLELSENLMERTKDTVRIRVELDGDNECRYTDQTEQNVFRIMQQGCENAIRHGRASQIHISGTLNAARFVLKLEDDGVGFDTASLLEMDTLLAGKHFGLVGMHERATLIGAELQINSAVAAGTRISLLWKDGKTD